MKKKFFIGIDISKQYFDVAYHNGTAAIYLDKFSNDEDGVKKMIARLKKLTKHRKNSWFFCLENTGVYSKIVLGFLCSLNYVCREENPLHLSRSLGIKRAKNDPIDAKDICQYAFEKRDSIQASQPLSLQLTNLRKTLGYRDLLVRKRVSIQAALKDQKAAMGEQLYKELMELNTEVVALLNEQIKQLDASIEDIIEQEESSATNHWLAQSVIGIGPITSAYIIAYTQNYQCFDNGRGFSCYCGTAPFPFESGSSIKKNNKVSYMGHRKIKALLSNGVQAAIQYDKELMQYCERKKAEGKPDGVVFNNIKNKLIHRVFAVVKRQTPYVPLNKHVHKPQKAVIHN